MNSYPQYFCLFQDTTYWDTAQWLTLGDWSRPCAGYWMDVFEPCCADGNAMFFTKYISELVCSLIIGYNASDKNGYYGKIYTKFYQ